MALNATLGRTAAFSLAAAINLYATGAILSLVSRFNWVDLPPPAATRPRPAPGGGYPAALGGRGRGCAGDDRRSPR
jgi:hypothetical protein